MVFEKLHNDLKLLNEQLLQFVHPKRKVLLFTAFLEQLIKADTDLYLFPFFADCIEEYLSSLHQYTPFYTPPEITERIITALKSVQNTQLFLLFKEQTLRQIKYLENELTTLQLVLNGEINDEKPEGRARFPILETGTQWEDNITLGFTEHLSIRLEAAKSTDEFFTMPGGNKAEEELRKQAEVSLSIAWSRLYQGKQRTHFYTVWILFHEQHGNYIGTSLGISLTLALLEALSVYNNNTHLFRLNKGLAFTGSVNKNGSIEILPDGITSKKTEICFYSDISTLIVPEENEEEAKVTAKRLRLEYPSRQLKIIGVESIDELLNRRNIIDIRKQPVFLRAARAVNKHRIQTALMLLLIVSAVVFTIVDFDSNPAVLHTEGDVVTVKNKFGKVLWSKRLLEQVDNINNYVRIVDAEPDGTNEVLVTGEYFTVTDSLSENERISCYNSDGTMRWKYHFHDTLETSLEKIPDMFSGARIVDTVRVDGVLRIVLLTNNLYTFPGCIYQLEIASGKEAGKRMYHPGHITSALVTGIYGNNNPQLLFIGVNNSEECVGFGMLPVKEIGGFLPAITRQQYRIKNKDDNKAVQYYISPKSDLCRYYNIRTNSPGSVYVKYNEKETRFGFYIKEKYHECTYSLNISKSFDNCFVTIGGDFRVARDTLVANGKLSLPYTDTPEYQNILLSRVMKWEGVKFVRRFSTDK